MNTTSAGLRIDNEMYDHFGERWYEGSDHPLALLRAESVRLSEWTIQQIEQQFARSSVRVLDLGCGAGLLANRLALSGLDVTAVDSSPGSLEVAARHDRTGSVRYVLGDATQLTFEAGSFDVVTAMDVLEHVAEPSVLIGEAARVLAPGGLFLFNTFNRNLLSWLVVIKGVEWFVRNTPPRMHVLSLFLKPHEVHSMCVARGLCAPLLRGFGPVITSRAFWRLLVTGRVPHDLRFEFQPTKLLGYAGRSLRAPSYQLSR